MGQTWKFQGREESKVGSHRTMSGMPPRAGGHQENGQTVTQGASPRTVYTQSSVMEPRQTPGATGIRKQEGQLSVKGPERPAGIS